MVDTNQCKMQPAYEEDEEEYADFYDYSAMDVDSGAGVSYRAAPLRAGRWRLCLELLVTWRMALQGS